MQYSAFDLWRMLAGIAIFLLGMGLLEAALQKLSGRSFKLFLKKQTSRKINAIAGGAVVTAILQSSSVVSLMILGFVGAGMMTMKNALGVILGANLGTTLTTWLVATLGFKIDIEAFALPLIGLGGIASVTFKKGSRSHTWSRFMLGFGFLFAGLDYMKVSVGTALEAFDFSVFEQYPSIFFLLAGIFITSLIQSSSATAAIILSALYARIIPLHAAMALVLGSEVGTTVKLLVASAGGTAIKKRVALGNFLFNTVTITLFFAFLTPVRHFVTGFIGLHDELIALSFFQTFVNIVAIILFYPFLNMFGNFLEQRFRGNDHLTGYIHKVAVTESDLAIGALEKEVQGFMRYVMFFCRKVFGCHIDDVHTPGKDFDGKELMEQYEFIKHLHGDIYEYYITLQNTNLSPEDTQRLDAIISSVRNAMYAAKSMKDAHSDVEALRNSSNDIKYNEYISAKVLVEDFLKNLMAIADGDAVSYFERLVVLYQSVHDNYDNALQRLYKDGSVNALSEVEISTVINFNRELYSALKSMTFAAKDLLLPAKDSAYFDELPGFIR